MNFIITLLILILILGLIITIHEFGHFISAKKSGVYVEEFAIGMGPAIWKSKKDKGGTTYTLRAFPIGGYVAMANEMEKDKKLRKDQVLENKSFLTRLLVLLMGIIFNFILCIVFLFINGVIYGSPNNTPVIGEVIEDGAAYNAGLKTGDVIKRINDVKTNTWDDVLLEIAVKKQLDEYEFTIERDGKDYAIFVTPNKIENEEGKIVNSYGIGVSTSKKYGFVNALKYSITGFLDMFRSISLVLKNLFTGGVSIKNLSGPVGIFTVIDQVKSTGFENIIYLVAYLSVNVGVVNLLPIPVFDGGRVLLLIIEAITKKKYPKLESILNYVGFGLMILLMLIVTFNDILKLF